MHGRRPPKLAFRAQFIVQPFREVSEYDGRPSQVLILRRQAVDLIARAL